MKITALLNIVDYSSKEFIVIGVFNKINKNTNKSEVVLSGLSKEMKEKYLSIKGSKFNGVTGQKLYFNLEDGRTVLLYGLGEKTKYNKESLRKSSANLLKVIKEDTSCPAIDLDSFLLKNNPEVTAELITESFIMTNYKFDKYKKDNSKKDKETNLHVTLESRLKKTKTKAIEKAIELATIKATCINTARDLVNEPPNVLHSEYYAKFVEKDVKSIKNVKVKIHGEKELKNLKMDMFLSVNSGSKYAPRMVELTYTPSKVTKNTKHISLVGKGLTFDSGGYSLKPAGSMINMKFDMAGSATVYGAFKALAMLQIKSKVTCLLAMTDNMVNEKATVPDSIVTSKIGKTVEILNTDAEGRLVLGDTLTYATEQAPNIVIDVATLTGACLVSLGSEICGVMGNNQKHIDQFLKSSKNVDEYSWQMPIIPEFKKDMKSNIADLKNIGSSRFGGTSKAAAFLEEFIVDETPWIHLDIAGVGDSQSHLPYCPSKGASGLIIRSLIEFAENY